MVLNLHGLYGNAENTNYKLLTHWNRQVISPQIDYASTSPEVVIDRLMKLESIDYIVGQSLGGFFALYLSNMLKVPCLVTNPCIPPEKYIPKLAEGYQFTDKLIELQTDKTLYTCKHRDIYMIVGCLDEVVDSKLSSSMVKCKELMYVTDGKHSLSGSKGFVNIFQRGVDLIEKNND